jgi:ABC-type transporter Mla MlaB component
MPTSGSHEVAFAIRGPISRADLPGLCERVCAVLARSSPIVVCDVSGVGADVVTVDALARLQLAALRRDCCVELCNASDELLELVELMGLSHVLVGRDRSEARRRRTAAADRNGGTPSRRRGRT